MSNIVCAKCGEPWDSTGGIHYTHSELNQQQYAELVVGTGCPACAENLVGKLPFHPDNIRAWRRSVEHLAEGDPQYMYETFSIQPFDLNAGPPCSN